jgi:REP element-mobilizing transposase RayT
LEVVNDDDNRFVRARGYIVSTVGRDEAMILDYIRHQEKEERMDHLNIWI